MVLLLIDVFCTNPDSEWKAPNTIPNSGHNTNLDYGIVSNPVRKNNSIKKHNKHVYEIIKTDNLYMTIYVIYLYVLLYLKKILCHASVFYTQILFIQIHFITIGIRALVV